MRHFHVAYSNILQAWRFLERFSTVDLLSHSEREPVIQYAREYCEQLPCDLFIHARDGDVEERMCFQPANILTAAT